MADETKELAPLKADVEIAQGYRIPSNIAALTEWASAKADQFRGLRSIDTPEGYRDAKRYKADMNRALKEVDAERKRVKVAWSAPLATFEAEVKSATRELTEVRDNADRLIKGYEDGLRQEKRERLERYWETEYPVYALCTGEAEEPFVPFSRIFDPDWVKRVSEAGDDSKPREAMDSIAESLAKGEGILGRITEPGLHEAALSELYRTLDVNAALDRAEQEKRRQADIKRVQIARDAPMVEVPLEPKPEQAARQAGSARYVVTIECATEAEKDRVVSVMKGAGIHGRVRRVDARL